MFDKKVIIVITAIIVITTIIAGIAVFSTSELYEKKKPFGFIAFEIWYIEYEKSTELFPIQLVNESLSKIRGDTKVMEYVEIESVYEEDTRFPIPLNEYTFTDNTHIVYLSGGWEEHHVKIIQTLTEISGVTEVTYADRIKITS